MVGGDYNLNVECLSTDAKDAQGNTLDCKRLLMLMLHANISHSVAKTGKDVTFNANSAAKGNYVYKISYNKG